MAGKRHLAVALAFGLAACGGGGENEAGSANGAAAGAEGEPLVLNEAEASALANEAAADEAADMNLYGGNAAAGETGNDL